MDELERIRKNLDQKTSLVANYFMSSYPELDGTPKSSFKLFKSEVGDSDPWKQVESDKEGTREAISANLEKKKKNVNKKY